ncbi:MAG TPA: efflux RND transporter periplasmic adaptor subunit, partial [Chitinophagaceae bacterium]|nr:efflux RND transporter periplasmic adaptor subunit [Chitinophagaceae bacterium]
MHRINKLLTVFASFIFIGSLFSCKSKSTTNKPRENPPTTVDVMIANPQPVNNIIEANGTVTSNESVELRPEVPGRLTYLNVPEGKHVAQGTVLARINSADLQAQLQKSRVQLQLAETNEKRLKTLLDVGGVNQSDYDAVVNQVNSLRADMVYTQTLIDKTVIRAPFSGTIGLRQVSPGAYVSSATVIATLQKAGNVKIDFTLPEQYGDLIKIGGAVDVVVDAAKQVRHIATIIALEPEANRQTRNLSVRAILKEGSPNPGAFVKVYVGSGNPVQAIMVPTNVIIPDDRNNQLILVKKGKASFVNVKTGLRSEANVEITEGVKPGDTVVVTGVLFARPNLPVRVRSVKTLAQLQ